jgi:hypothetical protein
VTRLLAVLTVLTLVALPDVASACAVCGAGVDDDQSRLAYLLTTAALSLLPLGMFGGIVLWLRRRYRKQREVEGHALPQH